MRETGPVSFLVVVGASESSMTDSWLEKLKDFLMTMLIL